MRLFKRGSTYYVEFARGDKQSLKTSDKKLAEGIFTKLQKEALMGRLVRLDLDGGMTLGEFVVRYLETRTGMSPPTLRADRLALSHLENALGSKTPLRLITPEKIEKFKKLCLSGALSASERPMKPVSVNSYLRHIKAALTVAVQWGYLQTRPAVKMLNAGKPLPRYLRKEEIEAIMERCRQSKPGFYPLLQFYLWTGARRNEALGLEWRSVNLSDNRPCAVLTGKGNKQRTVPILPALLDVLKPMRKESGRVFPPLNESTVTHWFKAMARECGVNARLHDLRHTAATYMVASGIPLTAVQEVMGHAELTTTGLYARVVKERLYDEMSKLKFD